MLNTARIFCGNVPTVVDKCINMAYIYNKSLDWTKKVEYITKETKEETNEIVEKINTSLNK
jgi:hypothetical protein